MFSMILMSLTFMILIFMLILMFNKLNFKKKKKNNLKSIECGFNNFNNKHIPLFNNFFIIMIIFMIFDLEFFLFIPMVILMKNFNWMKFLLILIFSLMFMFYSLIYEIKFNSIKWIN